MLTIKPHTVKSEDNLRKRVNRLFKEPIKRFNRKDQLALDFPAAIIPENTVYSPTQTVTAFLDFIVDAMPDGDVYLFGGVLRDLALLGREGFNSDIDLVVEGDWSHVVTFLESLSARKNKFGGYRLTVAGWPVDIWNAEETWAIKQCLVSYKGIFSLTDTTVLNWDAILMSWRTRRFICQKNYFEELNLRVLDIVLENNPNPLGMAVRVFRHLILKDAEKIRLSAIRYLANCAKIYSLREIKESEFKSYRNTVIDRPLHRFFEHMDTSGEASIRSQFNIASDVVSQELWFSDKCEKGKVDSGCMFK